MTQVRNHLRQEQRRQQDERTRIPIDTTGSQSDGTLGRTDTVLDGLTGHAGYHALRGVGLAGLQGFKRAGRHYAVGGKVYKLPTNSHAMSVVETLFRIAEVGFVMLGSRSLDRSAFLPTGAAFGLEAVDHFARWNRLQQVLFRASVGTLLEIQSAASADLDAAFAAFDRDFNIRSLERRMSTYSGVETTLYQAALRGVPAVPDDNLAAELKRWIESADEMRESRVALATKRGQGGAGRRTVPATRQPSTGGYSTAQCRQLLAQVREYDRGIAQMHANWASYVEGYGSSTAQQIIDDFHAGRRSNQDLYDRNCR